MRKELLYVLIGASLFLTGCSFIGPRTVARDRFDYTKAISESWKTQMLINMVWVRYGEAPIFLDVASVISQYELETQANVAASWQSPLSGGGSNPNINANTLGVGASGRYTDRPTITYTPISGAKYASSMMTPISPTSVLGLIQAGFPVDFILRLSVQSINGIHNRYLGADGEHSADPAFYLLAEKWRKLQSAGAITYRAQNVNAEESLIVTFRENLPAEIEADGVALRKLLGLNPQMRQFKVVYGATAASDTEIAILSRSVLQIMLDLSSYIEIPEVHVIEKRAAPTVNDQSAPGVFVAPLIHVYSSQERPTDAFVFVSYQDHWFWIDNKDLKSKQVFSFLMFVFTLSETGSKAGAPIVTIPAR